MTSEERLFNLFLVEFGKYYTLLYLLPIGVALWKRTYWNPPLRIFYWFLLVTFLMNCLEQGVIWGATNYYPLVKPYMDRWQITNTLFLYILFYLRDFLLLGYFYRMIIQPQKDGKMIWHIALSLSAFEIINYCFIDGFQGYGVIGPTVDAIFCFLLPAYYLWSQREIPYTIPVGKIPYYWFSVGLIIQNLIGLFFYYTADKLQSSDFKAYVIGYIIKDSIDIIGIVLFAIGFYHARYVQFLRIAKVN